jgi:hypothetical protein
MVPGTQFYFIASNEDAVIDTSKKLPSGIKFINKGYIDHYLNKDRLAEFKSLLDGIKIESINSLKSMRLFDLNLMKWVKNYSSFSLLLIFALFTFFSVKVWRMARSATINSRILFVCGLISIITEVALLTLFQISTGQIYYLYGLFAASFMLGLGFGSSFKRINPVYMAIWPAAVLVASMYIFIPSYMFIVLNFFGGLICGGIFYFLAVMEEKEPMNLYSFDLLGSAFGALIAGPLLLPVFGITVSLVIAILLAGITCRKYI